MPWFGYGTSSAATRPVQRVTPLPYQPSTTSSGVSPRGFPERVDLNQYGQTKTDPGVDLVGQAVSTAARAPGYIYERPLAAIDALTGGNPATGQKGAIEQGIDTLKSVPVLGDVIRGAGNAIDWSSRLMPAIGNAQIASSLKDTAAFPDSHPLDDFQKLLYGGFGLTNTNDMQTVGDLRRLAGARGWTPQDVTDLAHGKKGLFDFSDPQYKESDNPLVDLGGRLVLDPLNATLIAGPAIVGAASKVGKLADLTQATNKVMELARARAIVEAPLLAKPALGVRAGVAALAQGVSAGITHQSLGTFFMGMGRGGSALLGGYRKLAIGTTAVQLAGNAVLDQLHDKSGTPGILNDLYILGKNMAEDKPLSDSSLFSLWAVMHFPARDMIGAATGKTAGAIRHFIPTGRDISARLTDLLEPGVQGESYATRFARMVENFGGNEAYLNLLRHLHGKAIEGLLPQVLIDRNIGTSLMAKVEIGRLNNQLVDDLIAKHAISGQDAVRLLKQWTTGARNIKELASGLETRFDPQVAYQQWRAFHSVATRMDAVTQGAIVPKIREVLITEHLKVAQQRFKDVAKDNGGKVSPQDAQRIVLDNPALMTHAPTAQFWADIAHIRDHAPTDVRRINQRLQRAMKDAHDLRDVMATAETWEAKAGREAANRAGFIDQNGLDYSKIPTEGAVRVSVPTANDINRANAGFPAENVTEAQSLRSKGDAARLASTETQNILDDAGYNVQAVSEGVSINDGAAAPSVQYVLHPDMGPAAAEEIAALLLKESGAKGVGKITLVGDAVEQHGQVANGVHLMWQVGEHTPEQAQAVAELMNRLFKGVEVNDTFGVYEVVLHSSDAARYAEGLATVGQEMGAIFPGKVMGGKFDGQMSRAWIETVRNTGKGNRSGRAARAAGIERSVADIERAAAARSTNWHFAKREFQQQRDAYAAGHPGLDQQPAAGYGPVRQAAPENVGPVGQGDAGGVTPSVAPEAQIRLQTPATPVTEQSTLAAGFTPQDASALKGNLKWMMDRDAEASAFHTNLAQVSADGTPHIPETWTEAERAPLYALQADLLRYDPTYTMSVGPKDNTPFRIGQGKAYADTAMAKQVAGDLVSYVVTSKIANYWDALFGRVYTHDLANDAKQELFSDLIHAGASPSEVNQFWGALRTEAQTSRLFGRTQLWHRGDLLPHAVIDMIAKGEKVVGKDGQAVFKGFSPKVIEAMGKDGFSKSVNRASSRYFRKLEADHRAVDGKGNLGKLLDKTFGVQSAAMNGKLGGATAMLRAAYPLLRFKLDPRWHLMNMFEADILGAARFGIRRGETALDRAAVDRIQGRSITGVDAATAEDNLASGFLDARRLEGYIGPSFNKERLNSTRDALKAIAENDPVTVALRRRVGPEATSEDLVNELDRMMYGYDTKGVEPFIKDEAQQMLDAQDYQLMTPVIQHLTELHKAQFREIIRVFHGNVNRSNVERLLNSYFLYWPISYQLKVAKTLVDVLTKSFGGRKTDLLGAWTYDRMMQEHKRRLVEDPEYAKMFADHPEFWRLAGQIFPILPMDIGVALSRPTRYTASALGAYLGLWKKDKDYPDLTNIAGQVDAGQRILQLGLPYTLTMMAKAGKEGQKKN